MTETIVIALVILLAIGTYKAIKIAKRKLAYKKTKKYWERKD